MVVKIGIIKIGNIAVSSIMDVVLDERADREDIDVRTISSGSKMTKSQVEELLSQIDTINPDLIIFVCPNPSAKMPKMARGVLSKSQIPTIIIGDKPGQNATKQLQEEKLGYIIVPADPMIGARREFLDPTEMVIFNSHVMNVLSITGVFRLIHEEVDKVIDAINLNQSYKLPQIVVDVMEAIKRADFKNPYARSKAIAAYYIAQQVSDINIKACFETKNPQVYIPLVNAAHEMIETASNLVTEAREIEKTNNTVLRSPHKRDGSIIYKESLDN